jgi:hypothetical protein
MIQKTWLQIRFLQMDGRSDSDYNPAFIGTQQYSNMITVALFESIIYPALNLK